MNDVLATLQKLPRRCYLVNRNDGRFNTPAPLVCIVRGESGYYPIFSRAKVDALNAAEGANVRHVAGMLMGSMFGWEAPAADPDTYTDAEAAAVVGVTS